MYGYYNDRFFLIVKTLSFYNATIEQLTLNNLRAITSRYHLEMKFQIEADGVGEVRVVQVVASEFNVQELKNEEKYMCMAEPLVTEQQAPPLPLKLIE